MSIVSTLSSSNKHNEFKDITLVSTCNLDSGEIQTLFQHLLYKSTWRLLQRSKTCIMN